MLRCRLCAGRWEVAREAWAMVVSGAYPLKALGKTLGAAFGLEDVIFDPQPNKGTGPIGLKFTMASAGEAKATELPLSLKVVQALQERGDRIDFTACGRSLACMLDGVASKVPRKRCRFESFHPGAQACSWAVGDRRLP